MKIMVFQPPYPAQGTVASAKDCLRWMTDKLNSLKAHDYDLILLPEFANAPGITDSRMLRQFAGNEGKDFLESVAERAKILHCLIGLGVAMRCESRWFNQGILFGADGKVAFSYDKIHLTDVELNELGLTPGAAVPVFAHNGVRVSFAICFDLYFSEYFAALAAERVDLVLCPSYQRSESADRICNIAQTRALDSGAYLVRSSYAMDNGKTGGYSLVASPEGTLLANAGPVAGVITAEINPKSQFIKPASHGQPPVEHRTLIESHRRVEVYRPYPERRKKVVESAFPRLCAHRGLSQACPENTLPAFAAALAAGAHEIEFDLWMSADGVPVVSHDEEADRATDGKGKLTEMHWTDIRCLDAGIKHGKDWQGIRVPRLEEVLDLVDGRMGLNIHVKDAGPNGGLVKNVCDVLREKAMLDITYIAGCTEAVLQMALEYAPEVSRACLLNQEDPFLMIKMAEKYACQRVQFGRNVTREHIARAHKAGLICNLFWSDNPPEALDYTRRGIDVILTNCAQRLIAHGFISLGG